MDKKRTSGNSELRVFRILSLLLCLTLISVWMMSNIYARYTSQASGEDDARVAEFYISDSTTLTKDYAVTLVPNETKDFTVKITNKSEVAVRYTFDFTVDGNLPLKINMTSSDNQNTGTKAPAQESDESWTVEREAAVNQTDSYQVNFSLANADYKNSAGTAMITMTVKAEQID